VTHEEIASTIERLRELGGDGRLTSSNIVDAVFDGNNYKVRDTLIAILEQADPYSHIELPKDADGVPIHIGDEMDCGEHFGVQEVEGFIHGAVAFTVCDPQPARICTRPAHMTHHYHKPTIEDVLVDYHKECQLHASELGFVTDEGKEKAWRDIAATFAERLREVMADE
jgi:hypothetical protein